MTNFNNPIYPLNIADMIRVMENGTTKSLTERLADTPTMTSGRVPNTQIDAIPAWAPSTDYPEGNVVTYDGSIYKCNTTHTSTSTFDITKWDAISSSGTVRSFYQHIAASSSTVSSITLNGDPCLDINNMWVIVEHTVIPQSLYSLSLDGTTLNFNTPVDAGLDIDLRWFGSNQDISPEGANYLMTYNNYTTNRILEIPQDIKLELNNGTLTLKAGSKVYVPNGFEEDGTTPKFDVVTIESDLSSTSSQTTSTSRLLVCTGSSTDSIISKYMYSGNTSAMSSTTAQTYAVFYNTDTNKIYRGDSNHVWQEYYCSFPVAKVQNTTAGVYTSIDQVFNGFGYIGNAIFILPGIKCQISTGKNPDGTYTYSNSKTTKVFVRNYGSTADSLPRCYVLSTTDDDLISIDPTLVRFDAEKGYNVYIGANYNYEKYVVLCSYMVGTEITEFKQSSVDSVANSNASNFSQAGRSMLSSMGMPSSKYIDLTLGATGSTYNAPDNGWFTINKHGTAGQLAAFDNTSAGNITWITTLSLESDCRVSCPVKKGDSVKLWYNAAGTTNYFRFIYAEGEV